MNATAADWTHVEPLLDEAMHALDDTDRAAVLLRYFENKSLREVGQTLGTSENAAQKRLSRAVERLREFFAKRGVSVGASGLVVVISANAVQAAPVGLALTISTAAALAGTSIVTTIIATATKAIAMTTLTKTLISAASVIVVGLGIYQARHVAKLRIEIADLEQRQAALAEENQRLGKERDGATNRLIVVPADQSELLRLRGQVTRLNNQLAELRKPVLVPPKVLQNGERRRMDDFHDVGTQSAEAAFESLVWAARSAPQRLAGLIHLPEELKSNPEAAGPDLAALVQKGVLGDGNGSPWQEISLRGGSSTKFVQTKDGQEKLLYDDLRSYFFIGWDSKGKETEIHNNLFFRQFPDVGWKLVMPGFSPPTVPPVAQEGAR